MSIGKKLLELRQRRGLSQEELANHLHVSRQTISKWESDLSLPDMKMMLELSEYYKVSITELLGINDQEESQTSAQRIYEQTSLVLENFQVDTKRRKNRDLIIIVGICITCFVSIVFSMMLFTRLSRLEKVQGNNSRVIVNENTIYQETSDVERFDAFREKEILDLNQKTVQVYYKCTLKNYNDNTKVTILMVDINNKEYHYEMEKTNDHTFVYNKKIPLIDYESLKLTIDNDKSNKEVWDANYGIQYLSEALRVSIGLQMPKSDDGKLIRNEIHYVPVISQYYEENRYIGLFNEKMTITFYKTNNNELKEMKKEEIYLNEKKIIELGFKYGSRDCVYYQLSTVINGQKVEINSNKQLVENTFPKEPYQLMDHTTTYY